MIPAPRVLSGIGRLRAPSRRSRYGTEVVVAALAVAIAIAATTASVGLSPAGLLAALAGAVAVAWLLCSSRYELSFAVVLLYVGLADGYLKLSTGSSIATLGRDVVLYAIVAGAIVRLAVRRQPVTLPPLSGWVIGFTAIVAVEVLNPGGAGLAHALAATRQHIEWVPLFFAGYVLLTTAARLRAFFLLLGVVAAVNGVVAAVQLALTPEQLAAWGPGYSDFVLGTGNVSGRTFLDSVGVGRVRPFGLGSDAGAGGAFGLVAAPGVLAVLALIGRRRAALPAAVLAAGVILAIVTSEGRAVVLGTTVAIAAFVAIGVTARQSLRPLIVVATVAAIAAAVIPALTSRVPTGTFDRYDAIAPSQAVGYAYHYRIDDLAVVPSYVVRFPLGTGLGTLGPASGSLAAKSNLNGETNFGFLVVELGVPGLLLLLAFSLRVLWLAATRIKALPSSESRLLLAGLAAPLVAILISWIIGPALATPPYAPYFWVASGALAYWLLPSRQEDLPAAARSRKPR